MIKKLAPICMALSMITGTAISNTAYGAFDTKKYMDYIEDLERPFDYDLAERVKNEVVVYSHDVSGKPVGSKWTMTVNNNPIPMSALPIKQDNAIMVPARSLAQAIGFSIEWNGETKALTMRDHNGGTMVFTVGSNIVVFGGVEKTLETKVSIVNDYVMVPIKFFADNTDMELYVDEVLERIIMTVPTVEIEVSNNLEPLYVRENGTFNRPPTEEEWAEIREEFKRQKEEAEREHQEEMDDTWAMVMYMSKNKRSELSNEEWETIKANLSDAEWRELVSSEREQ